MKQLTNEQKDEISAKIEWEGFDYWLTNYASEQVEETVLEEKVSTAIEAITTLEEELREQRIIDW